MIEQTQPIVHDTSPAMIEEPPLKNQKSCLWRGCHWFLGCFVLLIIIVAASYWFFRPAPKNLAALPPRFPTDIPFYLFEERSTISYLSGARKDTKINRALLVPRLMYTPLKKRLNPVADYEIKNSAGPLVLSRKNFWPDLKKIWNTPVTDYDQDVVFIAWENINDKMETVDNYYQKNLRNRGYKIIPEIKTPSRVSWEFRKEQVLGRLDLNDSENNETVNIILEIRYPNQ